MAAAPEGQNPLNYEGEEAAILAATQDIGLDLAVEESGTIDLLGARAATERPHVVHISCHGQLKPKPVLLLEDLYGNADPIEARRLVRRLRGSQFQLLFLSACETAEAHPTLDSLAHSLVIAGVNAVLGWAAPVLDNEASHFAAALYRVLAEGEPVPSALAEARAELATSTQVHQARDWHLARLYLGAHGGGALATSGGPRRYRDRGRAVRAFLDEKGQEVPVASEYEFVGRRRQIQQILREFRAQPSERHTGVLIWGMGRQGKSSLAARVAHRLHATHETVVVHKRFAAATILQKILDRVATPQVRQIVKPALAEVDNNPGYLQQALTQLLEGPFGQLTKDADGKERTKPILLVLDDFESGLDVGGSGLPTVQAAYLDAVRATLLAFRNATTESRLLITSRHKFTLPHTGADLAERVLALPLPGMNEREGHKQASAKLQSAGSQPKMDRADQLRKLTGRIVAAADGNPGLQDVLFRIGLDSPESCEQCLDQVEQYRKGGDQPTAQKLQDFFERVALETLLSLLNSAETQLLRHATLFEIPVPRPVLRILSARVALVDPDQPLDRLAALGVLDIFEDARQESDPHLAVNSLIRPSAGTLDDEQSRRLAKSTVAPLLEHWGGMDGGSQRSYRQDFELARLAIAAGEPKTLAATAADAIGFLESQTQHRAAAMLANASMALLDATSTAAPLLLLVKSAEAIQFVGTEPQAADSLFERAVAAAKQAPETEDPGDVCKAYAEHARRLVQKGLLEEAEQAFADARKFAPSRREQAIIRGDIARLKASRGEVQEALALHEEELAVYEELGDRRTRAVTLGDIARLKASRGEVQEALALHEERLGIFEELGERRESAHTLWSLAQIHIEREEYQESLDRLAAAYQILVEVQALDGIATVGYDLGLLLCRLGNIEQGLPLLTQSHAGFSKLGMHAEADETQKLIDHFSSGDNPQPTGEGA